MKVGRRLSIWWEQFNLAMEDIDDPHSARIEGRLRALQEEVSQLRACPASDVSMTSKDGRPDLPDAIPWR